MTALHYFAPLKIGEAEAAGVPYRPLTWAMPARSTSSTLASYTWMADGSKYASARADGSGYVYKGYTVHHHITDKRVSFSQRILKLANGINLLLIVSMNY